MEKLRPEDQGLAWKHGLGVFAQDFVQGSGYI